MMWNRLTVISSTVALVVLSATSVAEEIGADVTNYRTSVAPFLATYCADCHGEKVKKGNLDLRALNEDLIQGNDAEHWNEVLGKLNLGEMQPNAIRVSIQHIARRSD